MKNYFPVFYITVTFFIAISCKNAPSPVNENGLIEITKQKITDISSEEDVFPQIDSCTFIALQTDKNCLIGSVSSIQCYDDKLFIEDIDGKSILVFDLQGNFLNRVGTKGNGPSEYYVITTFYINEDEKSVVILDGYKRKSIHYDLEGNFIESIPIDNLPLRSFEAIIGVRYIGNGKIMCHYGFSSQSNLGATISNEDFSDLTILYENNITYGDPEIGGLYHRPGGHPISKYKNEVFYIKSFCDTIYSYSSEKNKIDTPYLISAFKSVPDGFKREGQDAEKLFRELLSKGFVTIGGVFRTDKYLFINAPGKCILWDINEQMGYSNGRWGCINEKLGFYNLKMTEYDNKFIGASAVYVIKGYSDEDIKDSPKFKAFRDKLTEEDNGAIIIYHMR